MVRVTARTRISVLVFRYSVHPEADKVRFAGFALRQ